MGALGEMVGTTPRARGKALQLAQIRVVRRNNPAHAGKRLLWVHDKDIFTEQPRTYGESGAWPAPRCAPREQPRTCGEKIGGFDADWRPVGTTPHTRGKGAGSGDDGVLRGNNPAHAGKILHDQQVRQTTIEFSFNCDFHLNAAHTASTTLKFVTSLEPPPPDPPLLRRRIRLVARPGMPSTATAREESAR